VTDATTTPTGRWAPEYAERVRRLWDVPGDPTDPAADGVDAWAEIAAPFGPPEAGELQVVDRLIPGPHGDVPVRVYARPGSLPATAVQWMHGGAFIGGDLDMPEADAVARGLALRTGARVVSVDYRLAVDGVHHPVPGDDCDAVYAWLRGQGYARVVVGGASAGGNLAAGVARRAALAGAAPDLALLLYPVLHAALPPADAELEACVAQVPEAFRFRPEATAELNANYLGGASATADAFPGLADDLSAFPPTYLETDEFDDLRSSGAAFAAQLRDAGVDVEEVVAAGVPHGHLNAVGSPYAAASMDRMGRRIRTLDCGSTGEIR
jgi:xylan 1,4-beta-xylosidase